MVKENLNDPKKIFKCWCLGGAWCAAVPMDSRYPPEAIRESLDELTEVQQLHLIIQVKELARHQNPRFSKTLDVKSVEVFFELRDKGGPLGKKSMRVFFGVDDDNQRLIVLGVHKKEKNGKTPQAVKTTVRSRWQRYLRGDYPEFPQQ